MKKKECLSDNSNKKKKAMKRMDVTPSITHHSFFLFIATHSFHHTLSITQSCQPTPHQNVHQHARQMTKLAIPGRAVIASITTRQSQLFDHTHTQADGAAQQLSSDQSSRRTLAFLSRFSPGCGQSNRKKS
jgi:hypothetical protein